MRQYPIPMPVRPSPPVPVLASSSHEPNCRTEVPGDTAPARRIGPEVDGVGTETAGEAVGVDTFGAFGALGALGRPRPWAAASCEQHSATTRNAPKGSRRDLITAPAPWWWYYPLPVPAG